MDIIKIYWYKDINKFKYSLLLNICLNDILIVRENICYIYKKMRF